MDTKRVCGKCGAELTGVGTEQLCPGCLLEDGLDVAPASVPEDTAAVETVRVNSGQGGPEQPPTETSARRGFGDYELLEEIGRGGMGIVYKARQVNLDRLVAIKMLLFGPLAQPEQVQRFRTEAAAAASLQHPNIVAIHEVGFREGQHFFAMDYVAGRSLAEMVRDGPLPARRAAGYVKTVAEAIQYAHERGILHRDLKPSNVLINADDQPKVMDFGLAKRLEKETELTLSGQVLGSPNYMPPEQAAAHRGLVGKRSDVYSLGAILYHLLTGRAPFVAPTVAETLALVQNAEPVSPTILNPHLPRDLKTICLKCLEKAPARRYQTTQELSDELGRWLRGEPILARPLSRPEKVWGWCRRNPVVAALATTAVFTFLLGFAGVTWQGRRATRAAAETKVQRDLAQGHLYAAQMKLVHAACQASKIGRALELLRAQRPPPGQRDFRGFDWRFLYRLCVSPSNVLATNASGFQAVDFSPDGRTVAFGSGDGMLETFETQTWRRTAQWPAHRGIIASLAFGGRNTNWLATVSSDDGLLKLWDLTSRSAVFTNNSLRGIHPFLKLGFSPGGRFLSAPAPFTPFTLSLNLWEIIPSPHGGAPTVMLKTNLPFGGPGVFSPDERTMAVCNQPPLLFTVNLYDLSEGTTNYLGQSHSDGITCAAFSPDGSRLATGSSDECVVLWDVKRGATNRVLQGGLIVVTSVAFAPDGQTLFASCWDQNIYSWNLEATARPSVLGGHSAPINALSVSPDGRWLASASQDGTARVWSLGSKDTASVAEPAPEFSTLLRPEDTFSPTLGSAGVLDVAVSPDQSQVVAVAGEKLIVCDLKTGAVLTRAAATNVFAVAGTTFRSATFSPDGRRLAVGGADGTAAFLDAVTLQPLTAPTNLHAAQVTSIAYALGGAALVTGGGFETGITLTEVASGLVLTNLGGVEESFYPLQPLAVSPDGRRLATGSPDRSIRLWDIATRQLLATCPLKVRFPFCMTFSPDGRLLAFADTFGPLYLWDWSGRWPPRPRYGHSGSVTALAFSPDGTLASGGMDHTIRLWHPELDQEAVILTGHSGSIMCLAFAEHGNALVSGSIDGTLRIWRALSFEQIQARPAAQARAP